jgi:polysaccharide export outer membrane protein
VLVVGAVKKPGAYDLPRGSSSLLSALVAAEGLGKDAGMEVEIRRGGVARGPAGGPSLASYTPAEGESPVDGEHVAAQRSLLPTVKVNLAEAARMATSGTSPSGRASSFTLHDGDVVHVAKRTLKPVYVQGLVRKPGEFEYPLNQELRVLDALAMAGGVSNPVADQVLVLRQLPGESEPIRIALGIQAAKGGADNLPLAPGDTVMVEQTLATAMADIVQTFFRVGFSASLPMF